MGNAYIPREQIAAMAGTDNNTMITLLIFGSLFFFLFIFLPPGFYPKEKCIPFIWN